MRKWRLRGYVKLVLLLMVLFTIAGASSAFAQTSSSPNYQITESDFNTGTGLNSCSTEYCAQVSIGDDGAGSSASTAEFGEASYSEPMLEVIIEAGESNLGVLSTEETATKTTVIKVRNLLSGGYTLQIAGSTPTYEGRKIAAMETPTESVTGVEQFGINLVVNSTPNVGADPVQVPSDQGVYGEATEDYATKNLFKYVDGDVIARSLSEAGRTDYTISMITNISNATPAGKYTSDFAIYVVPAY